MEFSIVCAWKDLGDPARRASYDWTRAYWRLHFPGAELVQATPSPFTRARGLNAAIRAASHDVIVQADPDTIVPLRQLVQAVELAGEAHGLVVPYNQYLYLTRDATDQLHRFYDKTTWMPSTADCEDYGEGGAGPITVFSRRTWELARGYDERFGLWGGDDAAFAFACDAFVAPWRWLAGPCYHSWHPRQRASIPGTPEYKKQFALLAEYRDAAAEGRDAVRTLVESR